MTHVYTLKIRYSGEEDDVFVFSTREKAEAQAHAYFHCTLGDGWEIDYTKWHIDDFEEYLFSRDIGYFDIQHHKIN